MNCVLTLLQNVASLLQAIAQLSQYDRFVCPPFITNARRRIMFWSVADDLYNVDQLSSNRQRHIQTARDRGVSDSDLDLLKASFDHMFVCFEINI